MTALDTLTALADILELHGQKGKPGYELLHSPHAKVALQANIMYQDARSKGKSALEAQESIKLPHNLVLADNGKRAMGYGDITEAQHLANVKKAQTEVDKLSSADAAPAVLDPKPVQAGPAIDKPSVVKAPNSKVNVPKVTTKAPIIASWVGEKAMVNGNTLSYESNVLKNPDGSALLVNSDGMLNYTDVQGALNAHSQKVTAKIKKGFVTTKVVGEAPGLGPDVKPATPKETIVPPMKAPFTPELPSEPVQVISAPSGSISTKGWKQVGHQMGSNKGGMFEDSNGQRYYVKASKSDLHAQNEALAAALYHAAGLDIPDVQLAQVDKSLLGTEQLGIASKILPGKANLPTAYKTESGKADLSDAFAVHAWLSNWDAAGLGKDNMITTENGHLQVVDVGGSLLFRAQGGLKGDRFGNSVGEIDSLREHGKDNIDVFAHVTDADIKASIEKHVATVSPEQIDQLVDGIVTDKKVAADLKATLKARRLDLMTRYGVPESKDMEAINAPETLLSPKVGDNNIVTKPNIPVLTLITNNSLKPADAGSAALSDEQKQANALEMLANNPIKSMAEATSVEDVMAIMLHEAAAKKVGLHLVKPADAGSAALPDIIPDNAPKPAVPAIDETELPAALKLRVKKLRAQYGYTTAQTKDWPSRAVKWYPGEKEWKIVDNQGDQHFGAYGGAGVLIRSNGKILLTQRSASIHSPLTWSTPGGAMEKGESPIEAAKREAGEELGLSKDQSLSHVQTMLDDRGGWAYHTVILESPDQFALNTKGSTSWEQNDARWYTVLEIDALSAQGKLHPGFRDMWAQLRKAGKV